MFPSLNAIEIQKPIIDIEELETESLVIPSRQSQKLSENWSKRVVAALEQASHIDPYQKDIPIGSVIPAAQAVGWINGQGSCDIRPRLVEKATGIERLIDTGSQVSTTVKGPMDIKDKVSRLIAVNGTKINTYGVKEVEFKIGRKLYKVKAIVCDVGQDILGMDFMNEYKLGFEWDEFDQTELYLVDKKACIKEELQMVTVPSNLQRSYLASSPVPESAEQVAALNQAIAFQVACVKKLEATSSGPAKSP